MIAQTIAAISQEMDNEEAANAMAERARVALGREMSGEDVYEYLSIKVR